MTSTNGEDSSADADRTVVYHSTPDERDTTRLSQGVLVALDSLPKYEMEDTDQVVFDYVDLDALDSLFRSTGGNARSGHVSFRIEEYEVTVTSSGEITIETNR